MNLEIRVICQHPPVDDAAFVPAMPRCWLPIWTHGWKWHSAPSATRMGRVFLP